MDKKIVNAKLVICPQCNGDGFTENFNGDGYDSKECDLCKGVRVVKRLVTVEYQEVKEQK